MWSPVPTRCRATEFDISYDSALVTTTNKPDQVTYLLSMSVAESSKVHELSLIQLVTAFLTNIGEKQQLLGLGIVQYVLVMDKVADSKDAIACY